MSADVDSRSPSTRRPDSLKVVLVGAPGDTLNLGVSALQRSALCGIFRRAPDAEVTVFDNGLGPRKATIRVGNREITYRCVGLRLSRRWHRPESLTHVRASLAIGGAGNPTARALLEADAVLDVSGGDSFSDLYGQRRFELVARPKEMTLRKKRPLVLLPQTYGPYQAVQNETRARSIVQRATISLARDAESYGSHVALAGDAHRDRCLEGVDMAFELEAHEPWGAGAPSPAGDAPLVGVNVSGLAYGDEQASGRFGFRADYRRVVRDLIESLLTKTDAAVVLVAHVITPVEAGDSDPWACELVRREFAGHRQQHRLSLAPILDDPSEMKGLISRFDWFCGTRMHATIAALSSGVPAAGIAYSGKAFGVFATCGQEGHVADLRRQTTSEVVEVVWRSWLDRRRARATLAGRLPGVLATAGEQMDRVLQVCFDRDAEFPRRVGET